MKGKENGKLEKMKKMKEKNESINKKKILICKI